MESRDGESFEGLMQIEVIVLEMFTLNLAQVSCIAMRRHVQKELLRLHEYG